MNSCSVTEKFTRSRLNSMIHSSYISVLRSYDDLVGASVHATWLRLLLLALGVARAIARLHQATLLTITKSTR